MIPKIIHFCWLSGDKYPNIIEKCINTWKEKLPDYEFVLWDTNRFNIEDSIWVKQAFEAKKYAFAADYIRLYAVYNYGGIYMDTDIEVLKNFDDLLNLPYFIGSEGGGFVEAGIFGAEKNTDWVGDCLKYYDGKTFIKPDGTLDTRPLPRIMMEQIYKTKKVLEIIPTDLSKLNFSENNLLLFPIDYFCAKNQGTGEIIATQNTYTIHHFAMSWIPKKATFLPNLKRKLMKVFGVKTIDWFISAFGLRQIKKRIK
jgi:hypothetical protein